MRTTALIVLAVLGCGNKSKLDASSATEVDALWDLAPDGTELGIVGSARATGLVTRGFAAVAGLAELPDFASIRSQRDVMMTALLGAPNATPADAGLGDRGFALFVTSTGVLAVMPVVDRDKFTASKHGQRGSDSDTLDGSICKPLRELYVCASSDAMFDRVGKGSLRGKTAAAGARGDLELFAPNIALLDGTPGDVAVTAQLDVGKVAVRARWTGQPGGTLGLLSDAIAPRTSPLDDSGFVAINIAPLLAKLPAFPLAAGVTADQLAKTIVGPVSLVIPSGSTDMQIHVPLSDPGPATTVVEHCKDTGLVELAATQTPGACRFRLQAASLLELDAWVEGKELRIGAHKGAAATGSPGGLTPAGKELAAGDWTAVFWGRGTMLNAGWMTPATGDLPPQAALGIHAIALVNELGAGIKIDKTGVALRAIVRTAWDNPPDVAAKVIATSGDAIAQAKATEAGKAIAAAAPSSPFAADFAAGQGGLMVPSAVIGLASAILVPAFERYMGLANEDQPAAEQPPDEAQLVSALVHAYALDAYPKWAAAHPDKPCPSSLAELAGYLDIGSDAPPLADPWGHPLVIECGKSLPAGAHGIAVLSLGPDGKQGTDDDIRSW